MIMKCLIENKISLTCLMTMPGVYRLNHVVDVMLDQLLNGEVFILFV